MTGNAIVSRKPATSDHFVERTERSFVHSESRTRWKASRPASSSRGSRTVGVSGAHATTSSSSAANSSSSRVRFMKASSSDACCGDSSWSAIPAAAAASPTCSGGQPVHLERAALGVGERDARADELGPQPLELGRADDHDLLRGARDEVVDARVGDQLAAADHDQVVGGERHLAHQVGGDEDRAALGGEPLEQVPHPVDALRVEAVAPARRASPSSGRRAAPRRCRAAGPCRARTGRCACAPPRAGRRGRSAPRRGASGSRASGRARADGCTPTGRCGRSAPRAARRPRAAAPRGRGSGGR